jgi:subtilase family serine protease
MAACIKYLHHACYTPSQLQHAYDLTPLYTEGLDGHGVTIAIVIPFGSSTIQSDLEKFDSAYNLPAPPSFKIIQPVGPIDQTCSQWAQRVTAQGETSLDVEWAHAVAPGASLLLVETPVSETLGVHGFPQVAAAENYVIDHHLAQVISMSFAAPEETFPTKASLLGLRSALKNAQAHDVTVIAPTGDQGATGPSTNAPTLFTHPVVSWPASDPLVTAVGGLSMHLDAAGGNTSPPTVWNEPPALTNAQMHDAVLPGGSGGGTSSVFARPSYQASVASVVGTSRGVPDISMNAAQEGEVPIYSGCEGGWRFTYGTSESAPEFAGVVAIADQAAGHPLGLINPLLYRLASQHSPGIVDVVQGNNTMAFSQGGHSYVVHGYPALPGYDLASGLGTIDAAQLVHRLAAS